MIVHMALCTQERLKLLYCLHITELTEPVTDTPVTADGQKSKTQQDPGTCTCTYIIRTYMTCTCTYVRICTCLGH